MSFSSIPIRTFGVTDPSWWNSLRTAGILLENYLGAIIGETTFTLANNQVSAADVTGALFAPASIRAFALDYAVYRNTTGGGATELAESGTLLGVYSPVAGTWEMTQSNVGDSGITFTITNAGQIQYTSSNITGTPDVSNIKFKARSISA